METVKIDKNVPLPLGHKDNATYPFETMEVGDSFFSTRPKSQIKARAVYWGNKLGHLYSVRSEKEGVRCWRVQDSPHR